MDEFLKMDIFFVVSTIAVVVLTILVALILIRLLRILKKLEELSEIAVQEGEQIREDIDEVRANIKSGAFRIGHFLGLVAGARKPRSRTRRS